MPTCTNESISQLWKRDQMSSGDGKNGTLSTSPQSPLSPISTSPTPRIRRIPSAVFLAHASRTLSPSPPPPQSRLEPEHHSFFRWMVYFCFKLARSLLWSCVTMFWNHLLLGPTLWLSVCVWMFWTCISLPLTLLKWTLVFCQTSSTERSRKKRTVLISSGSTVQALHLARNFYCAGARVVVCEIEGLFGLSRFSTAVDQYYTVPKPDSEHPESYVNSLCGIVERENVNYYIPVSATSAAFYDAFAKPHLELLKCVVFCPSVKEVRVLDDIYEVLSRCRSASMPTPIYYHISSRDDLYRLYDSSVLRSGRHVMFNVGTSGIRGRIKMQVPPFRQDFRTSLEISDHKPWIIVQHLNGEHYITCTTVKESKVVANVSCRVEKEGGGLVPVEHEEITNWIQVFFNKLKLRSIDGHLSFRFVVSASGGTVVPLGCKVGVTLPYICHTSVHPKIIWKPCPHFTRRSSGPLVTETPRYWMHDAVMTTLKHPSVEAVGKFIGTVLDKREALFVYWDPLPYCAYYHVQLPIRNILEFVRGHRNINHPHIQRTLTVPVQ